MEALLKLPEVRRRTALGKSTIYKMMKEGTFPKNVPTAGRARAWSETHIDCWVKSRITSIPHTQAAH